MHADPPLAWSNPYTVTNGWTGVIDILPVPPGTTSITITAGFVFFNGAKCSAHTTVATPGA